MNPTQMLAIIKNAHKSLNEVETQILNEFIEAMTNRQKPVHDVIVLLKIWSDYKSERLAVYNAIARKRI